MTKYRTMQGREVDMDKLMRQNELMPAIGNVRVNARGDELGPGGKIIKKREEVLAEYYENNPKATPDNPRPVQQKAAPQPRQALATETDLTPTPKRTK